VNGGLHLTAGSCATRSALRFAPCTARHNRNVRRRAQMCRVSELDHLREEVAYLKFWLGIVVVTDISLAGWLISSSGTAGPYTVFFAVLGLILLSAGIVFCIVRLSAA